MSTEPIIRRCPVCDNKLKPIDTTYCQPQCRREAEGIPAPHQNVFDPYYSAGWIPVGNNAYRKVNFS